MKLTQCFHLMMDVKRDNAAQQVAAPDLYFDALHTGR